MTRPPVIGAMIGDPAGIGPEVCVKALASGVCRDDGHIVLVGDVCAVERAARDTGIGLPVAVVSPDDVAAGRIDDAGSLPVLECGALDAGDFTVGQPGAASGRAVKAWIDHATDLSVRGILDGWIMAPIDTASMRMAGVVQHLDDLQPEGTFMFRLSGPLRAVPIAEHLRMRDIPASVTHERICHVVRLTDRHLRRWGMAAPRLAVAGLNPHAMFEEDAEIIAPAVAALAQEGLTVTRPVSPDSVFRQCIEGQHDAVITMYHDQGQIALKTAAFEGACTVYLGLDHVQLSVPHGTAFDIAGTGKAQHRSMTAAMRMALQLAAGRGFLAGGAQAA